MVALRLAEREYTLDLAAYIEGDFLATEIDWTVQAPVGIGAELADGQLRVMAGAAGRFTLLVTATSPAGQTIEADLVVEVLASVETEEVEVSASEPSQVEVEEEVEEEVKEEVKEEVEEEVEGEVGVEVGEPIDSTDQASSDTLPPSVDAQEVAVVDLRAPKLDISGHLLADGTVEFQLRTDEELAGPPILLADGRVLDVEQQASFYIAQYTGAIGSIQVIAAASDLAGNTTEAQLSLSAGRGQGILSPDGRLRVQGRLGAVLLYGEENGYRVELEPGSTAELVFSGVELGQGLFRRGATEWEEIPAQMGGDALIVVVSEGGLFRLAKGSVAAVQAGPTAYPNPFNAEVVLRYKVTTAGLVRVSVYDALGAHIRVLLNRQQGPGLRTIVWDGRDENGGRAASGVYLLVVEAAGERRSRKVLLVR